jgi:hypothetical protein
LEIEIDEISKRNGDSENRQSYKKENKVKKLAEIVS